MEKLPGEKPVPENAIKGKPDNCNNRVIKENCRVAIKDDEEGRPRTCSFGEKGLKAIIICSILSFVKNYLAHLQIMLIN